MKKKIAFLFLMIPSYMLASDMGALLLLITYPISFILFVISLIISLKSKHGSKGIMTIFCMGLVTLAMDLFLEHITYNDINFFLACFFIIPIVVLLWRTRSSLKK